MVSGNRPGKILLVDGDPAYRGLLRALLEDGGYRVVEVGTGPDALHELRSFPAEEWSLVVLDLGLPGMSGWELLTRVRGDLVLKDLPLLLLSARTIAQGIGEPPVLRKPVDVDEFLAAVDAHRR